MDRKKHLMKRWTKFQIQKHALFLAAKILGGRKALAKISNIHPKTLDSYFQSTDEVKGIPIDYRALMRIACATGISIDCLAPFDIQANQDMRTLADKKKIVFIEYLIEGIFIPDIACECFIHNDSILVNSQGLLLAGVAPLQACQSAGMSKIGVTEVNLPSLLQGKMSVAEIDHLTLREKVAISVGLEYLLEDEPQLFLEMMNADAASSCRSSDTSVKRKAAFMSKICGLGSKDTFYRARQICFQGILPLVDAVERKQIPIATAAQIAKLPKSEQLERLKSLTHIACTELNF